MSLKISNDLYEQLRAHGEETYPHECCGIMLGKAVADACGQYAYGFGA